MVAREGPRLARGRQVVGQRAGEDEDGHDGREPVDAGGADGAGEDGQERVAGGVVEGRLQVRDGEQKGEQKDEAERAVDDVSAHHGAWHRHTGILGLLGHVGGGIGACVRWSAILVRLTCALSTSNIQMQA